MVNTARFFLFTLLALLLVSGFVIAEENLTDTQLPDGETNPIKLGNENEQPSDILKTANEKVNENLEREIPIPGAIAWLEEPIRFIFGIDDSDDLSYQRMIVLIILMIFFFIVIFLFGKLLPEILGKGISFWATIIIIFLIGSTTGIINELVDLLFHALDLFLGFFGLENYGILKLTLGIILIVGAFMGFKFLSGHFKKEERKDKLEEQGRHLGEMEARERVKLKKDEEMRKLGL